MLAFLPSCIQGVLVHYEPPYPTRSTVVHSRFASFRTRPSIALRLQLPTSIEHILESLTVIL